RELDQRDGPARRGGARRPRRPRHHAGGRVIARRLAEVRAAIDAACEEAGRPTGSVQLVAVSKTFPVEAVREAQRAGQVHFGESYAQELRDKARELPGVAWHFIGRLQTNKARYVAPVAHRVHALETVEQAEALSRRLD